MRTGDILYFSPKYKFVDLDWDDKDVLIKAFEDRVNGFFLKPIEEFNKIRFGFGSGVLCTTMIDFLARITVGDIRVGSRFRAWLRNNINEFNDHLAKKFYEDFRNGLVHEGRIKNCGQFSYDIECLIWLDGEILVVNPELFLERIGKAFRKYIQKIRKDDRAFLKFKEALERDFREDFELSKKMMKK